MARVPVRIDPHMLLETLVEVHYSTRVPAEVAFGDFYRALVPDFEYIRPGPESSAIWAMQIQGEPIFLGLDVVVRLRDGHIAINCVGDKQKEYLGWSRYREVITEVLKRLHDTEQILGYSGISVRYVNSLPWGPMNEQLAIQLPPDLPGELVPQHTHFRVNLRHPDNFIVNLALGDSHRVPGHQGRRSVFDVEVRWQSPSDPLTDLSPLLNHLDRAHQLEKDVFFGLLKQEFVDTLQPLYES
jgi:uncharacterized protein (TIGR04255 family)